MIRVLIVDDQSLIREGLYMMLNLYENIDIAGQAINGQEAVDILDKKEVDLILMDIRMPVMDGVEATRIIKDRYPETKILILTTFNEDEYIFEGLKNGADGYLLKELTIEKERNRIAGEIHDNIGHSLMALNINLNVIERIIDRDKSKTKELIDRLQVLTRESIDGLREAVYTLKEKTPTLLKNSIDDIINNIKSTGEIKVNLDIDEKVEEIIPEYKNIIYTSVKEALTNSINHGKAKEIDINTKLTKDRVIAKITDNGLGCHKLIKGNGLLGIENRINKLNGNVKYDIKKGFKLKIILPI